MFNPLGNITNKNDTKSVTIEIERNSNKFRYPIYILKNIVYVSLSLGVLGFVFFLGLYYLPPNLLYNFYNSEGIVNLFSAMGKWIQNNLLFVFLTWLLPIPFAVFLPLKFTDPFLKIGAIVFTVLMFSSFLMENQPQEFINFLKNTPEASYMWYDYITIILGSFITQPTSFLLLFLGPPVCVTFGNYTPQNMLWLYIILSFISIIFIIQISNVFINENQEFFILGYSSTSTYANLLQSSMILVWIRCFHIVCRDCYNTFKKYNSIYYRSIAIVWLFVGTILVEIWVSTAWTFHLAYSAFMKLEQEPLFDFYGLIKRRCIRNRNT